MSNSKRKPNSGILIKPLEYMQLKTLEVENKHLAAKIQELEEKIQKLSVSDEEHAKKEDHDAGTLNESKNMTGGAYSDGLFDGPQLQEQAVKTDLTPAMAQNVRSETNAGKLAAGKDEKLKVFPGPKEEVEREQEMKNKSGKYPWYYLGPPL